MALKLTLRMDPFLIQQAKAYAAERKRSVSQMVEDYFAALTTKTKKTKKCSLPITASLRGVLKKNKIVEQDYGRYLEEKYL